MNVDDRMRSCRDEGQGGGLVLVLVATRSSGDCVEQTGRPPTRTSTRPNTFHFRFLLLRWREKSESRAPRQSRETARAAQTVETGVGGASWACICCRPV